MCIVHYLWSNAKYYLTRIHTSNTFIQTIFTCVDLALLYLVRSCWNDDSVRFFFLPHFLCGRNKQCRRSKQCCMHMCTINVRPITCTSMAVFYSAHLPTRQVLRDLVSIHTQCCVLPNKHPKLLRSLVYFVNLFGFFVHPLVTFAGPVKPNLHSGPNRGVST